MKGLWNFAEEKLMSVQGLVSCSVEICKGKNLDKNLSAYINSMMSCYSRLSYIKFSMNYYTFCDVLREESGKSAKELGSILSALDGMIQENIVNVDPTSTCAILKLRLNS